jgi:hypothetical protein
MLSNSNFIKYLDITKSMGGILGFVSNRECIINGLCDNNNDFFQFMFYYLENNLNHFYYYFLGNFENKIRNEILYNNLFNRDRFLVILHVEMYNVYFSNVYGKEKELLLGTNKSIDKTIERILKKYDPLYLIYLKDIGYGQLSQLCFDIYMYYSFLGCSNDEFNIWIKNYRKFMEYEWTQMDLTTINYLKPWNYSTAIKVEQTHNIY